MSTVVNIMKFYKQHLPPLCTNVVSLSTNDIRHVARRRPRSLGYNLIMGLGVRKPDWYANNQGTDQPAYLRSLISAFFTRYLKGNVMKYLLLALGSLIIGHNGVVRMLKNYAHQRETTGSSSDSLQLCPFSKLELLLKEGICFQREQILWEQILSYVSSSFTFSLIGDLP